MLVYFVSYSILMPPVKIKVRGIAYIGVTVTGFLLVLTGGILLSRIIRDQLRGDIFNKENETFPQEERLLENEYSINLPAKYHLKNKVRNSWINIVNPFRAFWYRVHRVPVNPIL